MRRGAGNGVIAVAGCVCKSTIKYAAQPRNCNLEQRISEMLIIVLVIVLVLVFGGGGGYYGYGRWGASGGAGIGLGTVLLILLVCYLLGVIPVD
jgi:hypothetical protein